MKHYHKNPRHITKQQLADLSHDLKALGDLSGITHDLDTDEILTGNQRCEALPGIMSGLIQPEITQRFDPPQEDGTAMVGYFLIDGRMYNYRAVKGWNDKKREWANVAANKRGGSWDFDILANEFEVPDLLAWGFDEFDLGASISVTPWGAADDFKKTSDGDGIITQAGYRLSSIWYGMERNSDIRKFMLDLPNRNDASDGATVKLKYSRTNAEETERIVKTYMRNGDIFFEMCCGWMTFSSTAKYFGYSGKGGDIWDVSLDFCKKQIKKMPGEGKVDVIYADCRDTKEPDEHYDFIHSNPPFFSLEPYGEDGEDLSSLGSYDRWLDAMGEMGAEAERILKPGGLANFVINDYREKGIVVPMHADFINAILNGSGLVLHDLVVAEVISQALRFRKHDFERRRTVKCHEYIITFIKQIETNDKV